MNTSKLTAVTADGVEHGATPLRRSLARPEWRSEYFPNATRGHVAIVAAVCGVFLLTSFNRLNHTDLWGHLAFGRYIVEHGAVPTGDPFSAPDDPLASFLVARYRFYTQAQDGTMRYTDVDHDPDYVVESVAELPEFLVDS